MAQRSNSPATPPDLKEGGSGTTPATPGSATKVSKQSVFAGFKAAWRSFKTEVVDFDVILEPFRTWFSALYPPPPPPPRARAV